MAFNNYDPSACILSWNGLIITGFMDGTFINAERNEDGFTLMTGATGESCRTRNLNRSGLVTVTLLQTSASDAALRAAAALDELTGVNTGALLVKDTLNLTTFLRAKDAWIKKVANMEFAKEATGREWVFECADLKFTV